MSLKSLEARKLAVASLAALAALGTAASSAQAAKLTQNYSCKYPIIGAQPLKIDIDAAIPTTWGVNTLTNDFTIDAAAAAGGSTSKAMKLLGATSIEGTSSAAATLNMPDGFPQELSVPIAITNWTRASTAAPIADPLVLNATGATPPILFDTKGKANVTVNSLSLNLIARNATGQAIPLNPVTTDLDGKAITPADNNPATFDVPCKLVAGSPTKLVEITVNDGNAPSSDTQAPSIPGTVATVATATSGTLSWAASSDNTGVVSYEIRKNGSFFAAVKGNKVSLPGLAPGSSQTFEITARDAAGNKSEARSVTFSTPGESISSAATKYAAGLTGNAQMKTLITGNLPLRGGITADMKTADGTLTADLTLNNSTGRLNALGFLPVTAVVGFVSVGKTTGNLSTAGVLTTLTALRIKLVDVKLFGALSIAGGNSCQTKSLSNITLKSAANFDPVKGGDIAGSFSISDLNNCGILTGIVSPLTAGGGNQIKATLTPQI